jgi:RNA-binding protein YlmH
MFLSQTVVNQSVTYAALQAVTPLILLFSLYVQKRWADSAAKHVTEVKQVLHDTEAATTVKLKTIEATTSQTHVLVNSRWGVILANMSVLSREHATNLREKSNVSQLPEDIKLAQAAEDAAAAAENDFLIHQQQQALVDAGQKS